MAKKSESTSASSVSLPSASMATGAGGEVHQIAAKGQPRLTTNHGTPISDDHNSLKAGPRGPTLLEDFVLREKIFHFDHERIPERVVHARGLAAHGYFELTDSLSDLTTALVLGEVGKRTPVFARFSTVAGNRGSADLARDVRGFAVKFYTKQGNWDLSWKQHTGFFHPGRDEISRFGPCGEGGTRPRISASGIGARYLLGLDRVHARSNAHGHVADVRSYNTSFGPLYAGLRSSQLPAC